MVDHSVDMTGVFALFMNQDGEGCDYMIGCGSRLDYLEAETAPEALAEARALAPEYFDGDERVARKLLLVQVIKDIDPNSIKFGNADEDEDPERAEYERLKRKFG